jgi:hypothetical protein
MVLQVVSTSGSFHLKDHTIIRVDRASSSTTQIVPTSLEAALLPSPNLDYFLVACTKLKNYCSVNCKFKNFGQIVSQKVSFGCV